MWQHSCLFPSELEKLYSWLSEDDIAKFLTKTEWKKCKNMQNILLDGCYLFFEEYLQEKHLFIFPNHSEKQAKVLKKVYEEVSLYKYFRYMI